MGWLENMERIFGISASALPAGLKRMILVVCVIALGGMVGVAGATGSLHMRLLEFTLLILSMMAALRIHFKRPHALVPYALLMWVVSPELRRLLDWSFRSYTDTSLISLIPYCVSLTIREQENTLAKLEAKTWGVTFVNGENGKFLVLPDGVKGENTWTVGDKNAVRLVRE